MQRRGMLFVVLLALGIGLAWWVLEARTGQDVAPSSNGSLGEAAGAPTLIGRNPGDLGGAGEEVTVTQKRFRFGKKIRIRVVNRETGAGIPRANITAFFNVAELPDGHQAPEFYRSGRTDDTGSALFEGMPYGVGLTLRVGVLDYVTGERNVSTAATDTKPDPEVITIELVRELAYEDASVRIQIDWKGEAPVGDYKLIVDDPVGPSGVIASGQTWLLDRDPNGSAERILQVRVVGPGYAGEWKEVRARRGHAVSVSAVPAKLSPIMFQVVDEAQRPIGGVRVKVWPRSADAFRKSLSTIQAVTGLDGWARADVVAGDMISVSVEARDVFFPRSEYTFVPQASGTYMLQGARLVGVQIGLVGAPEGLARVTLEWIAVEMTPAIAAELSKGASISDPEQLGERYRKCLPREAFIDTSKRKEVDLMIRVLPGTYRLRLRVRVRVDVMVSDEQVLEVGTDTCALSVRLNDLPMSTVHVTWLGDQPTWPLLHAAVFGHGAGWRERFALLDALGSGWVVDTRLGDFKHLKPREVTGAGKTLYARLPNMRKQGKDLPHDLGFLTKDGVVEIEGGVPDLITIVRGDSSVAVVSVRRTADGAAVATVSEALFCRVRITLIDSVGNPLVAAGVFMGLPNQLHVGKRQMSVYRQTGDSGVASFGLAPGDVGAIHLVNAKIREIRSEPEGFATLLTSRYGELQYVLLHGPSAGVNGRLLIVVE